MGSGRVGSRGHGKDDNRKNCSLQGMHMLGLHQGMPELG